MASTTSAILTDASPAKSTNDEEASLEDVPAEEFKGVTLQISQDCFASRSPSTPGDSVAKLPISCFGNGVNMVPHGEVVKSRDEQLLRPAVSSGVDVISPISLDNEIFGEHHEQLYRRTSSYRPQSPMPPSNQGEAKGFFTYRDGVVCHAIQEVRDSLVAPDITGEIAGAWLLTEINHWDYEKERIVVLTDLALYVVKYDFIGLKQLEFRKVPLNIMDRMMIGELTYPEGSLVPRITGIAGGLVGVVRDCLVRRVTDTVSTTVATVANKYRSKTTDDLPDRPSSGSFEEINTTTTCARTSILSYFTYENFEPRARNVRGVRTMWNKGQKLSFKTRWNPFSKTIPFLTFASHPLLWCKGGETNKLYDVDLFSSALVEAVERLRGSPGCLVEHGPILIENYIGLPSLIHNTNDLGFFKTRGKVSF